MATAVLGDSQRAVALGKECLTLSETHAHLSRSWALWSLGFSKWLTGDRQQAGKLIRESLRLDHQFDNQWGIAHSIEVLAWIAAADGDDEHAARLLGTAHKIWESVGTPPTKLTHLAPSHAQCEDRARQALGNEKFAATFHEGTHLTLAEAIEAPSRVEAGTTRNPR